MRDERKAGGVLRGARKNAYRGQGRGTGGRCSWRRQVENWARACELDVTYMGSLAALQVSKAKGILGIQYVGRKA